jgi:hypothetical protein
VQNNICLVTCHLRLILENIKCYNPLKLYCHTVKYEDWSYCMPALTLFCKNAKCHDVRGLVYYILPESCSLCRVVLMSSMYSLVFYLDRVFRYMSGCTHLCVLSRSILPDSCYCRVLTAGSSKPKFQDTTFPILQSYLVKLRSYRYYYCCRENVESC